MSISVHQNANGSYTAEALVREPNTPFAWFEHNTYYGYRKTEIRKLFRQYLNDKGLKIQRDAY